MKKMIFAGAVAAFTIATVAFKPAETKGKEYVIDTQKTTAAWEATKVTGKHNGALTISKGTINYDGKVITGGEFEFDMNSITCADLTDKEWNDKLIGHLKSDDFFSVAKFQTAKFQITSVKQKSGDNYDVTGKLTIKGITHDITFPAVIKATENALVTVAKITVNRTLYDIKYGSASFFESIGDKAISDNFDLQVKVTAFPKK
jgi:polyisoprenoid-binding protein YceI